ncbi:ABC transporter ATP-binding protein [Pelagibacterium xiamenense]|uniref:ABC transporter ATP-binding protein n=1 Tax=Pelagibacterium xiamenense TaxID=2901140 RepID=UPI001E5C5770|nr:sn-glycerol-3-phosphate ABC transporter ATP-binding protein UgpC [Pelagibacterium xiamenense]MCD7058323.1 sn-glycerol-3-phosphate ABC transporter ATP-binding protein UgpC [Pelagibacterium xiamenense]
MSDVTLKNVRKSYGALEVIHGIDLDIRSGEFVVFVGPSGCGKSTLLRMIAGLEAISGGDIGIGGRVVNNVPSPQRGIAMVFQSYALYPHMSVYENMAFGLRLSKAPQAEIDRRVNEAARILQIESYLSRMPKQLSGGQRQRVAIGRAIVRDPKVFLFDEPLSNLDAALRAQTRVEIAKLHETLDATMIYVTHDQVEAMTLADKIVVLNAGVIEQVGTPLELYRSPANTFVAEFIGGNKMNLLPVKGSASGVALPNGRTVPFAGSDLSHAVTLGVRPEHLERVGADSAQISGAVEVIEQLGEFAIVHFRTREGDEMTIKLGGAPDIALHEDIHVALDPAVGHVFDDAGRALRAPAG